MRPPTPLEETARDGDLARTDARQPVPLRDRPGSGEEIYLRSAAGPLLSLLCRGEDRTEPVVLRAVSEDGTLLGLGRALRRVLPRGLPVRRSGLDALLPGYRARPDRHRRHAQRRLPRADHP